MHTDDSTTGPYCLYPARLGEQVDVTEQVEDGQTRYIIRNRATSRYFLLRAAEYQIFQRIDGENEIDRICVPTSGAGPKASRPAVVKFLSRLDSFGLLARGGAPEQATTQDRGHYARFKLFNPDRLLARLDVALGWAMSRPAIIASFTLMGIVALGMVMRGSEVTAYTGYVYSEYGLAVIVLFTLVIATLHEMAHGLACKHFGGDVPEVGILMVYYIVPAFYCNVTDIYRFGKRSQRVWVVMAGIYWQLLVSAAAALVWLVATPQTLIADFCFLVFLGGTFNLIINCNPLIKLDGYYAMSQMLGVENLQHRSAEYVCGLTHRLINGPAQVSEEPRLGTRSPVSPAGESSEQDGKVAKLFSSGIPPKGGTTNLRGTTGAPGITNGPGTTNEPVITSGRGTASGLRWLYIVYWVLSIAYSIALIWIILAEVGNFLMDWLGFLGILLTLAIAGLLGQRFGRPIISAASNAFSALSKSMVGPFKAAFDGVSRRLNPESPRLRRLPSGKALPSRTHPLSFLRLRRRPADSSTTELPKGATHMSAADASLQTGSVQVPAVARPLRGRLVKTAIVVVLVGVLIAPWQASAGSDCTLLLPPGRETAARANVDAVLAEMYVQTGDMVNDGAKVARLSNPDLEDRLTELTAQIKQLDTRNSEIEEELRVRSEELLSANFKQRDHERIIAELKQEAAQIAKASGAEPGSSAGGTPDSRTPLMAGMLPPALAVLQSEVELKQVQLEYERKEVVRYKTLFEEGLVGEIQYDAAVNAVKTTEKELQTARARLEAAMIDHRRLVDSTETGALVAQTEARAARSNFDALISELHSNHEQLQSLRERHDISQHQYDGMNVLAPRSGVILGEDLQKMIGKRFSKGDEICRVGDLERFLLKIDVSERDISRVTLESPVRFKLKTVPGRTFTGRVSKIRAESTPNQYGQGVYPVEVLVENPDGMLRPGMTGFARVSFGRQSIGLILVQKVWQALRPEMWLF
jgi:multidrug efflux pump subunit AcrA (membrane-fusion protein)